MADYAKTPAIAFENVSFRYSEHGDWQIRDISLSIHLGEWVSIIGSNGSGKSTLIKLMNGLLIPNQGRVLILGEQVDSTNLLQVRQNVGVIFHNPDEQTVGTSVEEDIAFGLQNLMLHRDEMISRIDHVMDLLYHNSLALFFDDC